MNGMSKSRLIFRDKELKPFMAFAGIRSCF